MIDWKWKKTKNMRERKIWFLLHKILRKKFINVPIFYQKYISNYQLFSILEISVCIELYTKILTCQKNTKSSIFPTSSEKNKKHPIKTSQKMLISSWTWWGNNHYQHAHLLDGNRSFDQILYNGKTREEVSEISSNFLFCAFLFYCMCA